MPLEFKNLPLEISALIQDFWIPRGYKTLDTVFQELLESVFIRAFQSPGAFALGLSRAWYDYQWEKSGVHVPRHVSAHWPLNPTTEHTTWVQWCQVRKLLQVNGVRLTPQLRTAWTHGYINNRTGLII